MKTLIFTLFIFQYLFAQTNTFSFAYGVLSTKFSYDNPNYSKAFSNLQQRDYNFLFEISRRLPINNKFSTEITLGYKTISNKMAYHSANEHGVIIKDDWLNKINTGYATVKILYDVAHYVDPFIHFSFNYIFKSTYHYAGYINDRLDYSIDSNNTNDINRTGFTIGGGLVRSFKRFFISFEYNHSITNLAKKTVDISQFLYKYMDPVYTNLHYNEIIFKVGYFLKL